MEGMNFLVIGVYPVGYSDVSKRRAAGRFHKFWGVWKRMSKTAPLNSERGVLPVASRATHKWEVSFAFDDMYCMARAKNAPTQK